MADKEIMEAREVAEYLHLHLFTIHKLAREGEIPAFKIGNDWRFRRASVETWVKNREKVSVRKGRDKNTP